MLNEPIAVGGPGTFNTHGNCLEVVTVASPKALRHVSCVPWNLLWDSLAQVLTQPSLCRELCISPYFLLLLLVKSRKKSLFFT